jgi:hypothetical protein
VDERAQEAPRRQARDQQQRQKKDQADPTHHGASIRALDKEKARGFLHAPNLF